MPDDTCATCGPNAVPDQGLSFARLSACEWNGCGLKPCLFGRVVKFIDVASDGNRLAKLAKHLRLLVRPLACKADKPQKDDSGAQNCQKPAFRLTHSALNSLGLELPQD